MPAPDTLVLASGNAGKLAELTQLLAPLQISVRSLAEFDVEPAEEIGDTFEANARLKAEAVARGTGLPALADDSGLCVDALDGAPGVHSARFAGEHGNDAANNTLLLDRLAGVTDRRAHFACVMALVWPDGRDAVIADGRWPGRIATAPQGDRGFGYDPLFLPDGETRTAAELPADEKNRISHRGRALRTLLDRLRDG